jgi:hypothetical protein
MKVCSSRSDSPWSFFFLGAIAVDGSEFTGSDRAIVIGAVNCSGSESSLLNCSYESPPAMCGGGAAGIVCQGGCCVCSQDYCSMSGYPLLCVIRTVYHGWELYGW